MILAASVSFREPVQSLQPSNRGCSDHGHLNSDHGFRARVDVLGP